MKKTFVKRITAVTLCIMMIVGLMSMTAVADTTSVPGAEGHVLTDIVTGTFDDGYDSTIIVYVTPNVSDYMHYYIKSEGGSFDIPSYDNTKWYFAGWKTWYKGSHSGAGVINSDKANPNYGDSGKYFTINPKGSTAAGGFEPGYVTVLKEYWWKGTYYLSAIFEPIVTINAEEGISYNVSGAYAVTNHGSNRYSTRYNNKMEVNYSVDEKYVVTSVGSTFRNGHTMGDNKVTVSSVNEPGTISIYTRLKQQKVNFDANGGAGEMTTQTFEYDVAQTLTANAFARTGYTFAGWNTKANGSGTGYADKESVTFEPHIDGDNVTLYAQWTQCTNHSWEDGKCTKCDALCSHSGGTATCIEQATCISCGEKYGKLATHNMEYASSANRIIETCTAGCTHTATADLKVDNNISTVYTGAAIEALKVDYSDNWQGGNLGITYSDNVNAGTARGRISIGGVNATQTFEIKKATMTNISAQGYSGIYDGQPHDIVVKAPQGATVSYKVDNGGFVTEKPSFKDAGNYTVEYKVSMANYTDVEGTAEVNILKAPLTVQANNHHIKFGEEPANDGVTYSGFVANETESVLGGMLEFDYTYAKGDDVGAYDIIPKGLNSNNYDITYMKGDLTVDKADATCTAPIANDLIYTGEMQELVIAGTANGGTMMFSFDKNGVYSTTLLAKEADTYTVWYKVIGDDNHNDSVPASITVEIKKEAPKLDNILGSGTEDDTTKTENMGLIPTGDNSHLLLWIVLLISSGIVFTFTVVKRKKQ